MERPKEVGEKTEAAILNHYIQKGIPVSIPWGNNQRYDLVLEISDTLVKCQCKTGRYKDGVVMFMTASKSGGKTRRVYAGEVDYFLVYCPELEKVYRVSLMDAPNRNTMTLRVDQPKNGAPITTIRWAKDYED